VLFIYLCTVKVVALTQMINFKKYWLAILPVLLLSCRDPKAPKDLIDKKTMVNILTDVQISESKITRLSIPSFDSSVVVFNYLQQKIFEKYKVDSAAYANSYAYYAGVPEVFAKMFEQVQINLEELEKQSLEPKPETTTEL
jgi:hypothetical protein